MEGGDMRGTSIIISSSSEQKDFALYGIIT